MKHALHHDQIVAAGPDAPRRAECPACGWPVLLKRTATGWIYSHAPDSPYPCSHRRLRNRAPPAQTEVGPGRWPDDPAYALALQVIRRTILDALDGYGVEELTGLFSPLAQVALQRLLGTDEEQTLEITRQTCRQLLEIVEAGQGRRLRSAVAWGSMRRLQEFF